MLMNKPKTLRRYSIFGRQFNDIICDKYKQLGRPVYWNFMAAPTRFERVIKGSKPSALPLGYGAIKEYYFKYSSMVKFELRV